MRKNTASQVIGAEMVSASTGAAFTGSVTVYVTIDGGTQAIGTVGSGACTHEGNGYHTYTPSQAETNGDLLAFTFIGTGAVPQTVQVFTNFPQTGDSYARIGAPAGASIAADIAAAASNITTILGKFTGITLLAQWLGALAGKHTPNATAQTEINATGAGSGTYDATTDSQEAIRDNGGGGLTAQQTRDAMKLAPSAGSPAAGSVDADLDTLITRTAGGVTVTFVNPVSQNGRTMNLVRGQAYLDSLSNAIELDITNAAFSSGMTSDDTTVTLKLQKRKASASPILITGSIDSVDGTTATVKFDLYRSSDDDSSATFGSIELEPGDNRYRFDVEFAMAGDSANRLTPIADGVVNVTADIPDAA